MWCCHRTSSGGCAWSRFLCCPGEAEKTQNQSHTAGVGPNPKEQSFTYTAGNIGRLRHSSGDLKTFAFLHATATTFNIFYRVFMSWKNTKVVHLSQIRVFHRFFFFTQDFSPPIISLQFFWCDLLTLS